MVWTLSWVLTHGGNEQWILKIIKHKNTEILNTVFNVIGVSYDRYII